MGEAIMKILGVALSANPKSTSTAMVREILRGAAENGHETQLFEPAREHLRGCTGCHACKGPDSDGCVQRDALTDYFAALPDADIVVLGAGIYMSYPNGQAWDFMNRHFSLKRGVFDDCRIPAGKRLLAVFAQGAPDNPDYRAHYEEFLKPFDGFGFVRLPVLVAAGRPDAEMMKRGYEAGKAL